MRKRDIDRIKLGLGVVAAGTALAIAVAGSSSGESGPQFGRVGQGGDTTAQQEPPAPKTTTVPDSGSKKRPAAPSKAKDEAPAGASKSPAAGPDSGSSKVETETVTVPAPQKPPSEQDGRKTADGGTQHPTPKPKPKPKPKPAPASLTADRVRALPGGASLEVVEAKLGRSTSISAMRSKYGAAPVRKLVREEPPGTICRYYRLADGEPAPFVRLCFDANGKLISRDFVAPPS